MAEKVEQLTQEQKEQLESELAELEGARAGERGRPRRLRIDGRRLRRIVPPAAALCREGPMAHWRARRMLVGSRRQS